MELATTILGVLSIAVALLAVLWQKRGSAIKRIHYTAICQQSLLDRGEDAFDSFVGGPITVTLEADGSKFVWPMVFKLKLANTGHVPIVPTDFSGPLSINFGEYCEFLGGDFAVNRGRADEYLASDSMHLESGKLKIAPFLLNPGDEVTISGILNGVVPDEGIVVSGRIAGVETLVRLSPLDERDTADLELTSLVYASRREWPPGSEVDVKVVVTPKFLHLDRFAGLRVSTRINGSVIREMHQVTISAINNSEQSVDLSQSLSFDFDPGSLRHLLKVTAGDHELAGAEVERLVSWSPSDAMIRIGKLGPRENRFISFIAEGAVDDLKLTARPSVVKDVQVVRLRPRGDSLEANLLEMAPRILIASPFMHRGYHSAKTRLCRRIRRARRANISR